MPKIDITPIVPNAPVPALDEPLNDLNVSGPGPTFRQTFSAVAENDVGILQGLDWLLREEYPEVPGFDPLQYATNNYKSELENGTILSTARARSPQEFEQIRDLLKRKESNEKLIAESGATGVVLQIGAGILSPLSYLPLVGQARGLKAVAQGMAYVGAGAAGDEAMLQFFQEGRKWQESALNIGAGVALGGILGGAVGAVRSARLAKMERLLEANMIDNAEEGVNVAIPKPGEASSVGAARSFDVPSGTQGFAGREAGIFSKFGVGNWSLEQLSPVTRQLNNIYASARRNMAWFSDAGLRLAGLEEGKVGAEGGNITALRARWNGPLAKALVGTDEVYAEYVFGQGNVPKLFGTSRAIIAGQRDPRLLNANDFNTAIARYLRMGDEWKGVQGDPKATEAVKKAGDIMRKEVYTPMFEESKRLGLLPEDIKVVGDAEYLNRLYNIPYIKAHYNDFVDILADHIRTQRERDFKASAGKTADKLRDMEQEIEDLSTEARFVEEKVKALEQDLANWNKSPIREVMDEINELRAEADELTVKGQNDLAKTLLDEAETLEKANLKEIEKFKDVTKAIRKRLQNMTKHAASIGKRRDAKLRRITALEEQQLNRFDRVARAYEKMQRDLKSGKLDPAKAQAKFDKLQKQVMRALKYIEKREEGLAKIADDDNGDLTKTLGMDALEKKKERLQYLTYQILKQGEFVDNLDAIRAAITQQYMDIKEVAREMVSRKALRIARLKEEVMKLNPNAAKERIEFLKDKSRAAKADFIEKWRERGFSEIELGDLERDVFDLITDKRMREYVREKRGVTPDQLGEDWQVGVVKFDQAALDQIYKNDNFKSSPGYEEAQAKFKTANDALKWIMENSTQPGYQDLARRMIGNLDEGDTPIFFIKNGDIVPFANDGRAHYMPNKVGYVYIPIEAPEDVMMHELLHAASFNAIQKDAKVTARLGQFHRELLETVFNKKNLTLKDIDNDANVWAVLRNYATDKMGLTPTEASKAAHFIKYFLFGGDKVADYNLQETFSMALTDRYVQQFLKSIKMADEINPETGEVVKQTMWSKFVSALKQAFGVTDAETGTAMERILNIADSTFKKEIEPKAIDALDYFDPKLAHAVDNGARDIAQEIVEKIIGSPIGRLANYDILAIEERGPELARLLNIRSEKIEPFLENNAERLMRAYVRTMAPDIEIFRKYGSVNARALFEQLENEYKDTIALVDSVTNKKETLEKLRTQLKESNDAGERQKLRNQINVVKNNLTSADVRAAYEGAVRDFEAVIGRMRHTWGVPEDPTGWAARGVRIAQNLNTLRMMGMVAVSSIPDIARTVMKFGPVRAYEAGLKPLFASFKELKLSAKEAQLAGTALDLVLHTRMYELMDLADNFAARTKGEQALEFLTSKMGVVSGFDYWNFWMKSLAGAITNAEVLDNIATVMDKAHKGLRTPKKASEYLAGVNIDGAAAHDIWRLVNEAGGGGKVNGVWLPATEEWKDAAVRIGMSPQRAEEVKRIYQAALVREVDTTIVTPGVERPLWMDKTLTGKLLGQFRSFAFSSTQHTLMAGLQEKDARFALGTAMSLALGGLSYYLWTLSAQEEGERNLSWDKFVDEAIDRSGVLGVLSEVRSVGSTIPWMNDYLMLSGERTTRRGGEGTVGTLLGPSLDLAESIAAVINQLDSPTQSTANQARKMMPFNNVWWLRRLFDQIVENSGLPERRVEQ